MSDYVPEEVLTKILTRVPPKSLIKFKCVSKSWNSLISSSYFVSLQTRCTTISNPTTLPSNQILIGRFCPRRYCEIYALYNDDNSKKKFPFEESIEIECPFSVSAIDGFRIAGSCNGVLCLYDGSLWSTNILLWNPVTKRKVKLPCPQLIPQNTCAHIYGLGFGFDARNNDYKVVRLSYYVRGNNMFRKPSKVKVYSLHATSWHEINVGTPRNCVLLEGQGTGVYMKGNVHWMAVKREDKEVKNRNLVMLFDVSLELFDQMQLPEPLAYYDKMPLKLFVIKELFAVCQHSKRNCSIWIMNQYGDVGSWSKMFNVRLSGVDIIHGFRTNDDILLTKRRRLVSYNLDTRATVDLEILGEERSFYVGAYVESLALINEGEEDWEIAPIPSDTSESESESESSEIESESSESESSESVSESESASESSESSDSYGE